MIKRLFIIGLLTGLGHLGIIMSLKFITKNIGDETIAFIGELDSLSLMIVSIIAFGLQLSTTRELALLDDWKNEYYSTQSARFSLSLFLMLFGFLGFIYTKNFLFFMAPIIALNADYALYGLGKPVEGAKIAFIRVIIPSITLVLSSIFFKENILVLYSLSLMIAYLFTGLIVSRILKVSYLVVPKLKDLFKYFYNIRIGLASFSLFFIGIGIVNIMSYFYNNEIIAVSYLALKLYMIFKGVRRIIVQAFFKELKSVEVAIKIDLFAMTAGTLFLISLLFFPNVIISLLFDEKYATYSFTFLILAIAGFISSITTSSGTRLLLSKNDKQYSINHVVSALVTISVGVLIWFLFESQIYFIALSVLAGEITLSILNIIALKEKRYIIERLKVYYPIFLFSLLFIPFRIYYTQSIINLIFTIVIFGIFILFYIKNVLIKIELKRD